MEESERGIFTLGGLTGYLIAVVLLLSILGALTYASIVSQTANAEVYYTINQDLDAIKAGTQFSGTDGSQNHTLRTIK
ncbi:MAG: DUF4006 family protein [Arcobacteraceae bacterium]|nr:DUF4006 family protein [Arcobacteraceae bacterium]